MNFRLKIIEALKNKYSEDVEDHATCQYGWNFDRTTLYVSPEVNNHIRNLRNFEKNIKVLEESIDKDFALGAYFWECLKQDDDLPSVHNLHREDWFREIYNGLISDEFDKHLNSLRWRLYALAAQMEERKRRKNLAFLKMEEESR